MQVHSSECSEARYGVAVASSDLDQAAVLWAGLVGQKEEERAAKINKPSEERIQPESELGKLRLMMTQSLAQKGKLCRVGEGIDVQESSENYVMSDTEEEKGSGDEESERGGGSLDKEMEKGGKRRAKRKWKKRAGAGLPASKRQKLSQD